MSDARWTWRARGLLGDGRVLVVPSPSRPQLPFVEAAIAEDDVPAELWTLAQPLTSLHQAIRYRSNLDPGSAWELEPALSDWLGRALATEVA